MIHQQSWSAFGGVSQGGLAIIFLWWENEVRKASMSESEGKRRLGEILFSKRTKMNMTPRTLSRMARVPKTFVLDIERGYTPSDKMKILFVINKLDLTIEERKEVYNLLNTIFLAFKDRTRQIQNRPGRKSHPRRRPSTPIDIFLRNRTFSFSY